MLWNQASFSSIISFDSLWTPTNLSVWFFFSFGNYEIFLFSEQDYGLCSLIHFPWASLPQRTLKKATIVVKVTMAWATSGSVWGFGVGSRNICTMEGRGEKVESLSNCLASLVTTKCWQVLPSTCLPLVLVCLCCEARKSWPKAFASFKLLLVFVTLQLLLLIAKTSLRGCTTLNCKPAGMS